MTKEQERQLKSRRRVPGDNSEHERWRRAYRVLFPSIEYGEIPNPYCDYSVVLPLSAPSDTQNLENYGNILLEEVRRALEMAVQRDALPIEEALRGNLLEIIRQCHRSLLDSSAFSGASSTSAVSTQVGTQQNNGATNSLNTNSSPQIQANSLTTFLEDDINSGSGHRSTYPHNNHTIEAATPFPSTANHQVAYHVLEDLKRNDCALSNVVDESDISIDWTMLGVDNVSQITGEGPSGREIEGQSAETQTFPPLDLALPETVEEWDKLFVNMDEHT